MSQTKNQILRLRSGREGLVLGEILILGLVFMALIFLGVYLINRENADARDAERLATARQIQDAFELLYNNTLSYEEAAEEGCSEIGQRVSQCNLSSYFPGIAQVKDPGKFDFIISQLPTNENYEVTFTLERSHGDLKAGKHTLSEEGMK